VSGTKSLKQSIDENRLSLQDLPSRVGATEPSRAVDHVAVVVPKSHVGEYRCWLAEMNSAAASSTRRRTGGGLVPLPIHVAGAELGEKR
jgi:hypothetical protein